MAYRTKSFAVVREQIETLKARYQPRFIFMTDNIFAQRSLDELLDWLREREIGLDIFYEVKSNLNRDQVRRLSEAGVSSVQPGIESFSTSILKLMRKGVSAAQNIAFLRYAREYGISPSYNIIIGFPGEDASEYDAVLAQFPLLVHLPAPSSIPFVEFHRFSPYHNDASSFGLKLTANPAYRVLFPYVGTDLDEIAYYFVDAGASTNQADLPYFDALTKATLRWGRSHDAYRPQLAWSETRAGISIEDRRFPGEPIKIRLLGASIEVFHLLDKPQSVASLARALRANWGESPEVVPDLSDIMRDYEQGTLPIYFDRQSFLDDPATCLSLLTDARLLFVDSNAGAELLYVALPIRHDSVPSSVEWRRAHV
jgi:ribosomal peptide maturation radical SAM protein 1